MRQLHLHQVSLPLLLPFQNATGTISDRQIVLVGITQEGHTGWGEAAPYPGITDEPVEEVWAALIREAAAILEHRRAELPAVGAAAVDEAEADLDARLAGVPLWKAMGGSDAPVYGALAIGTIGDLDQLLVQVETAVDAGFTALKLKIAPGWDLDPISRVQAIHPEVVVAADANGAYDLDDPLFDRLDEVGIAYLEQPLATMRIHEHAVLRQRIETPICLDESVSSVAMAERIIQTGAADIVCLKPARLGIGGSVAIADLARRHGLALKASGLLESSIGKGHTLAVATLPGVEHVDLSPASTTLAADVTRQPWTLVSGAIEPRSLAGIGLEPDPALLSAHSTKAIDLSR